MADSDAIRFTLRTQKGHFRRAIKASVRLCATALGPPAVKTSIMSTRLTASLNTLIDQHDKVSSLYDKLMKISPDDLDELSRALTDIDDEFYDAQEKLLNVLTVVGAAAQLPQYNPGAAGTAAGATKSASFKAVTDLKPYVLTKDHTPSELNDWATRFKAFFNASNMAKLQIAEQQAYFFACIDSGLSNLIKNSITTEKTPIFAPEVRDDPNVDHNDNCMGYLEAEFTQRYPLVSRRYQYFKYYQSKGQSFSDFEAKLKDLQNSAQLEELSEDEIHLFRIVCGLRAGELKNKIMEIPSEFFNLENVVKQGRAYEAAQNALGGMGQAGHQHTFAGFTPSGRNGNGGGNGQKGQFNKQKLDQLKRDGLCFGCGKPKHGKNESCRAAKLVCHGCGSKGHIRPVCFRSSQQQQQSRSKKNSRANTTQNSRAASPTPPAPKKNENIANLIGNIAFFLPPASDPTPRLKMHFFPSNGEDFCHEILPDSGATRSIFPHSLIKKFNIEFSTKGIENESLHDASGNKMSVDGLLNIKANFSHPNGRTYSKILNAIVSKDLALDTILLGWRDLEQLKAITIARSVNNEKKNVECPTDIPAHLLTMKNSKCSPSLPLREIHTAEIEALKEKFSRVFSEKLSSNPMEGPAMHISLKKGVKLIPSRITTVRQTPLHLQKAAAAATLQALEDGIISRTEMSFQAPFISRGFFVPKSEGKARIVVDYSPLNNFIDRPVHPFNSGLEILKNLKPNSRVFAKLDCTRAYFQVPLDEESKKLTTFLLPGDQGGCFVFNRAPLGLASSGDEWCRRSDEVLRGLTGCHKLIDDILIEGTDYPQLFERIEALLVRCEAHNITLSPSKFEVGPQVNFGGYFVSGQGFKPSPKMFQAILDMKPPVDVKGVKRVQGLIQRFQPFEPKLASNTTKLRALLKKGTEFLWTPEHQQEFDTLKQILTTSEYLIQPFDENLQTEITCDASRNGLGFCLTQKEQNGKMRIIQVGSRSLTPAEQNYAMVELECSALYYAIRQSKHFLFSLKNFVAITDHSPLLGMFQKPLSEVENKRVRRFREKLSDYHFSLNWIPGAKNTISDCFSRSPVAEPDEDDHSVDVEDHAIVQHLVNVIAQEKAFTAVDPQLQPLYDSAAEDSSYQQIITAIRARVNFNDLPPSHPGKQFKSLWEKISIFDNSLLVIDCTKIIVPASSRKWILELLHIPHAGITRTQQLARERYFWHGMSSQVKALCTKCEQCQRFLPSQQLDEPQILECSQPMEQLGADIFYYEGKNYLAVVDKYSFWLWCFQLRQATTAAVTRHLQTIFADYGKCFSLITDNGPCFRETFDEFCKKLNIVHKTSSPYFPRSNGISESGCKVLKFLLSKCNGNQEKFYQALSELRNTPSSDGRSPAQKFLNRNLRGQLPTVDFQQQVAPAADFKSRFPKLPIGTAVIMQNPLTKRWGGHLGFGIIKEIRPDQLSYVIELDNGKQFIRNRSYLKPVTSDIGQNEALDLPAAAANVGATEESVPEEPASSSDSIDAPRRSNRTRKVRFEL